jgi:hypothetical protein
MILDLKKEVVESKTREADLIVNLNKAKTELGVTKKQLGEIPKEVKQNQSNIKEGFFATASGLYVKPLIDHRGNGIPNDLDAEPGFQVSTGYQANDNWDYTLKYRHFNADTVGNIYSNAIGLPIISARYKNNYNVLEFEIGKQFLPSDRITFRVSGGIRYTALGENFSRDKYNGDSFSTPFTETKIDFWSIGPRITAAPTWKPFGNNFRIFSNVGVSFLMGQQHETYLESYHYPLPATSSDYYESTKQDRFVTMIDAGSGLGYTIKANLVDIDFQTGYQFEHWSTSSQGANILFTGFHGAYGTIGVKF